MQREKHCPVQTALSPALVLTVLLATGVSETGAQDTYRRSAGGDSGQSAAQVGQGTFTAIAPTLITARAGHASTLLNDGRVLITGGFSSPLLPSPALDTAEIYDPVANAFTPLASRMASPRTAHAATRLADGRVLLTGGQVDNNGGDGSNSAEIFNPATLTFALLPAVMNSPRGGHAASLLGDGRVLICGGFNNSPISLNSAELFNPSTGQFTPLVATLVQRRDEFTAVTLPSGKVLLAGGSSQDIVFASAELFDPATLTFSAVAQPMTIVRAGHRMSFVPARNSVLVTGGAILNPPPPASTIFYDSAELFNAKSSSFWALGAKLTTNRGFHAQTTLANGTVLITGGGRVSASTFQIFNSAEIYSP